MAWLNRKPENPVVPKAQSVKHTFDVPVKLRLRGVAEPVHATLLHIALSGCRLRCWMMLERGTATAFDWRLSSGRALQINGTVAARYPLPSGGAGFEYAVALEQLPESDADALAREAALLARQTASARSYDTSIVDISQFTGYRVADEFAVTYRTQDVRELEKHGHGCDVSGNGLRLRSPHGLRVDETIVLQFTLPEHVLYVHKGKDDDLVVGPFGYRRVTRKYLRRPFARLKIKARVVSKTKDSHRRDAYEVQFLDADGLAREELARYIHASQLAHLKTR